MENSIAYMKKKKKARIAKTHQMIVSWEDQQDILFTKAIRNVMVRGAPASLKVQWWFSYVGQDSRRGCYKTQLTKSNGVTGS